MQIEKRIIKQSKVKNLLLNIPYNYIKLDTLKWLVKYRNRNIKSNNFILMIKVLLNYLFNLNYKLKYKSKSFNSEFQELKL